MNPRRAWLVTVGEPLPMDGPEIRLMRCGLLRRELAARGWETAWFTSDFSHFEKRHRAGRDHTFHDERGPIHLLHGCGYRRNVSWGRLADHRQVAAAFTRLAARQEKPGVVVCSMPTIELAGACAAYCRERRIPLVIDIRDLWPDLFVQALPRPVRPFGAIVLAPYDRSLRRALRAADAIWGVSQGYLDWGLAKCGRARREADRVHLLGYPDPGLAPIPRAQACADLGIPHLPGSLTAWFIGSWGRTYDLEVILEAARRVQGAQPRIRFILSGDGDQGPAIRAAAAGLDNVHLTGWADRAGIVRLMAVADVGLAAYAEGAPQGIPNKVIEYLAGGVPVLSTLGGECRDLLAEARLGWTIPPADATRLAATLLEISRGSGMEAMGQRCRRYFTANLSADVVYPRMASDLEALLGPVGRTRAGPA